jgi:hypothetical protein
MDKIHGIINDKFESLLEMYRLGNIAPEIIYEIVKIKEC